MERLIQWGVRRYVGGPGRSWLFTTVAVLGYRAVRSTTGRREIIDIGSVGKGQKIVIEHLPVTHRQQLKDAKVAKRSAKKEKRATKKENRVERKAERSLSRRRRREERSARKTDPST